MSRKPYPGFSTAGSSNKSTKAVSSGFGDSKYQPSLKQNEKKSDNVIPNRRRSRLGTGTYRASLLLNQDMPLIQEKPCSQKKVQSEKKVFPSVASTPSNQYNNCVKKRLFSRTPTSRRLNMDTSDITQLSEGATENQDPNVTGVCPFKGVESVKKTQLVESVNSNFNNIQNRKHLSSLDNYNSGHLRSAKKSTPSRLFLHSKVPFQNSPKISSVKRMKYDSFNLPKRIIQNKEVTHTPSPPKQFLYRFCSEKTIKTPEMSSSTAAIIAAIRKRHSSINFGNCGSTENSTDLNCEEESISINKKSEVEVISSTLNENSNELPMRESIAGDNCNGALSHVIGNKLINYDPDNSLEAAYVRVNGTYDIVETITKNTESLNITCEGAKNNIVNILNTTSSENKVAKSNDSALEKLSCERSPSFINFNKSVNLTYELDDSTQTFIYNETLCCDKSLENEKCNNTIQECSSGEGDKSTIKKKKLSMIAEESVGGNVPLHQSEKVSFRRFSSSSVMKINHPTSMQKATCDSNDNKNDNTLNSAVDNLVLKLCETIKHVEKSNKECELFFKKQDKLINSLNDQFQNLKLENEQFLKSRKTDFISTCHSLIGLKDELKILMESKDINNTLFNSSVIESTLTDAEKIVSSYDVPVGLLETPEHGSKTLSKSIYNQLKTDYSCLKTPKRSTQKNLMSGKKILTPHSMSLCVQDQVDQLFRS